MQEIKNILKEDEVLNFQTSDKVNTNVIYKIVDEKGVFVKKIEVDGMQYLVFQVLDYSQSSFALNLTKEKLEIELLRKQLSKEK